MSDLETIKALLNKVNVEFTVIEYKPAILGYSLELSINGTYAGAGFYFYEDQLVNFDCYS